MKIFLEIINSDISFQSWAFTLLLSNKYHNDNVHIRNKAVITTLLNKVLLCNLGDSNKTIITYH